MLLNELGDRKIKVRFIRNDERVLEAQAIIGDRRIDFDATHFEEAWNVVFSEAWYDEEFNIWREGNVELTGSGNEFAVLSMITTCLKELLKKNPQRVQFTANKYGDENKRISIYRRLASKVLVGFELEEVDIGNEVEFRFTKSSGDT